MARLRRFTAVSAIIFLGALAGCRSAMVDTTITNATSAPVRLLELDYPSASFGVQTLAPGASFHYRFKILGSGPLKLSFTDSAGQQKSFTGPSLHEQQQGPLQIVLQPTGVDWKNKLRDSN